MYTSEKTYRQVLPQPAALESVSADKVRVSTKRGTDTGRPATGVQHGRGETPGTGRHPEDERSSIGSAASGDARVFVLDRNGKPLMPCRAARARELLRKGRARVVRLVPFVIRIIDRTVEESEVDGVAIGIDPGSKVTGISVHRIADDGRIGLFAMEINHHGELIHKKMQQRKNYRRGRRSRNLRYRKPRFDNRTKPSGWLAPSLKSRVDNVMSWIRRLQGWAPVNRFDVERVSFDTQLMQDAEISGTEYQRGTLYETEVRQYVLTKWNHQCAYCGIKDVPLNLDHVIPKSRNGSNRVSNLVASCIPCNVAKDDIPIDVWLKDRPALLAKISTQLKTPLRDAAAVQSTRNSLFHEIALLGIPVNGWSGGRTKWNRNQNGLPKSHALDALCVGEMDSVHMVVGRVLIAEASSRGRYQRTLPDRYGFPRARLGNTKRVHGFQTGDIVHAIVPRGKNQGVHVGRIAVRKTGSMRIGNADGINHRYCRIIQRDNGFKYSTREESALLPAVNGGVSERKN